MTSITAAPIRVLFIDHTARISGGEIALANLVRHLDRAIVDPSVLLFESGPLEGRLREWAPVTVISVDEAVLETRKDKLGWRSALRLRTIWLLAQQVRKVARFARHSRADIIHTNSLKADIIGGLAAKLAGIPLVWHIRDRIEPDYLPASVVSVFRRLCRILPDFIIANSTATLATVHLKDGQNSAAIASGVVPPRSYAAAPQPPSSSSETIAEIAASSESRAVRIGLIGRISPWKGQNIFIEAAAALHADYPRATFEIIGAPLFSEADYERELHQLARSRGVEQTVLFAGFVDDVPARIAQLDIVVHASTVAEPFGQVIIEGMAARKPVVATNGGGVPEIVVDGVTGILVPMGDAPAMANAIRHLLEHPEAAARMGELGHERAMSRFSIASTSRQVEDVYRRVLAHHLAHHPRRKED